MTALNDARAHARRKKFEAQQADAAERERQQARAYQPLNDMMAFEDGTIDYEDLCVLFQYLVDTGLAWSLQGAYGRAAQALIEDGSIHA